MQICKGNSLKLNKSICSKYIQMGNACEIDCANRHILTIQDMVQDKEKLEDRFIKLELLTIKTANHFTMRVKASRKLAYFKWKEFNTWHSLSENLRNYYALPLSHRIHASPKIGDLCVILMDDKPYRCCVEKPSSNDIAISLIDYGETKKCKSSDLLVLKKEFYDVPAQVVNVYIAGIRPADNQSNWLSIATSNVKHWFECVPLTDNPECYIEANVMFQLRDTLLVDDIKLLEKLPSSMNKVISIKKALIENKFAVSDFNGIKNLRTKFVEFKNDVNQVTMKLMNEEKILDLSTSEASQNALAPAGVSLVQTQNIFDASIPESVNKLLPTVCGNSLKDDIVEGASSEETKDLLKYLDAREQAESSLCSLKLADSNKVAADLEIIEKIQKTLVHFNSVKFEWASLEDDRFNRVEVSAFYTPDNFYLRNTSKYEQR